MKKEKKISIERWTNILKIRYNREWKKLTRTKKQKKQKKKRDNLIKLVKIMINNMKKNGNMLLTIYATQMPRLIRLKKRWTNIGKS